MDDPLEGRPPKRIKLTTRDSAAARRVAGLSRWTGNHPEDSLLEPVIKSGYFDKGSGGGSAAGAGLAGVSATGGVGNGGAGGAAATVGGVGNGNNTTDSNSGRTAVWASLTGKNSTGTQMLSHIFTQAMEKRATLGRCTAPPTFKPPPRVTVTDAKREAWLRDLATPSVPLRKQSRTIPHGIRGRALLEQAAAKQVPVPRALWLVRCVGANEMRAYRRKGVTGALAVANERRWVREWTIDVENFMADIVARCGQPQEQQQQQQQQRQGDGWVAEMSYVGAFVAALFNEKLLDIEHFLDWIVASYSSSSLGALCFWERMVRDYWVNVTAFGRRGRKLAEATIDLLLRLERIRSKSLQIGHMIDRLRKILGDLQNLDLGCSMMIPRTWAKSTQLFMTETAKTRDSSNPSRGPASNLRDGRLGKMMGLMCSEDGLPVGLTRRIQRLLGGAQSQNAIYSSSPLLQLFARLDSVDVHVDIDDLESRCSKLVPDAQQLVSALFDWASTPYRTGHSRIYLAARLIARILRRPNCSDEIVRKYLKSVGSRSQLVLDHIHRVVVELMRLEVLSIGQCLRWYLTTAMVNTSDEPDCATAFLNALPADLLPYSIANTRSTVITRLGKDVEESATIDSVLEKFDEQVALTARSQAEAVEMSAGLTLSAKVSIGQIMVSRLRKLRSEGSMTLGAFTVARQIVSTVHDIAALGELIEIVSDTSELSLLATAVDTVTLHATEFAATGILESLVDSLMERFNTLRTQQTVLRPFVRPFSDLISRLPQYKSLKEGISQDEALCDVDTTHFGCSPASDSLVNMQGASLDSDEEIAAVFASGNTMDEQLMSRVFQRVIKRSSTAGPEAISKETMWLNQLRAIDSRGFENLVQGLLHEWAAGSSSKLVAPATIAKLVASGSVELSKVIGLVEEVPNQTAIPESLKLLSNVYSGDRPLHDFEQYRFRVQQELCRTVESRSTATLIRIACDTADSLELDDGLLDMLSAWILARPGNAGPIFWQGSRSDRSKANAGRMVSAIVKRANGVDSRNSLQDAASALQLATPLSLPFCVGLIRHIRSGETHGDQAEARVQSGILETVMQRSAVSSQLLEFASDATKKKIHASVLDGLINAASKQANDTSSLGQGFQEHVDRGLDTLLLTSNGAESGEGNTVFTTVTEQMRELAKELETFPQDFWSEENRAHSNTIGRRIRFLADLVVIYCAPSSSSSGADSEACTHTKCDLLSTLCNLLVHPSMQTDRQMIKTLLDTASVLSDSLPRDILASVKRPEPAGAYPYINSILGASPTPTAWLALTSNSPAAPSGMETQQRRALNRRLPSTPGAARPVDKRMLPFPPRPWETLSDSSPIMGENDASVGLPLFGSRRV